MIIKDVILRRSKEITLLIMRCRTPDLSSTFISFPKLYELGFLHSGSLAKQILNTIHFEEKARRHGVYMHVKISTPISIC